MKTLTEHVQDYLEHQRSLRYSPRTLTTRREILAEFALCLHGMHGLETADRLQRSHLEAWQQHLQARRTLAGLPLRPGTVNLRLRTARGFLAYLAERGFILKALISALERVREPITLPQSVLEHAQVRKLLGRVNTGHPAGYRNRVILELLYSTGLRARELLTLDVGDIKLDDATATVQHGKGDKARVVPVGRTALRFLQNYIVAVRPFLLVRRSLGEGGMREPAESALFLNNQGERFRYGSLLFMLRKYTATVPLKVHVSPHTFRRSCATEMIRAGANLYHVKELLGHETLKSLRHYVRLTITDLKKTHEKCHPRERDSG
jgi:integrase/recombinase XerD